MRCSGEAHRGQDSHSNPLQSRQKELMGLPRRRGDIALGLPPVPQQTQSRDWPRDSQASRKHDITSLAALTRILQAGREGKGRRGGGVGGPGWLNPLV